MIVYKAYRFRMYPDNEQKIRINQNLGSSRFVYNYYLDKKINLYQSTGTTLSIGEMKKDLLTIEGEYPWLREVD